MKLTIGPVKVRVRWGKDLDLTTRDGIAVYDRKEIVLRQCLDPQELFITLLHELLHFIDAYQLANGLGGNKEPHPTLDLLSGALHQLLRDNWRTLGPLFVEAYGALPKPKRRAAASARIAPRKLVGRRSASMRLSNSRPRG